MSWVEGVNKVLETVIKIAAIVAAVAAIDLLDPKPQLVAAPSCKTVVDRAALRTAYSESGKKLPAWVSAAATGINRDSSTSQLAQYAVGSSACAAPVIAAPVLPTSTYFEGTFNTALSKAERDRLFRSYKPLSKSQLDQLFKSFSKSAFGLKTKYPTVILNWNRPGPSAADVRFAQDAVVNASQITATVSVANRGSGGATGVRVEPPPGFAPRDSSAPFDLSPGEVHFVRYVAIGSEIHGPLPVFRAFGSKARTVNTGLLWGVGIGLAIVALLAFVLDRLRPRKPRSVAP